MKTKQILIFLLLVGMVWSCRTKDDNTVQPSIVGEWSKKLTKQEIQTLADGKIEEIKQLDGAGIDYTAVLTMKFNNDNTGITSVVFSAGIFSKSENKPFTWSTEGNTLITKSEELGESKATYTISGNQLTLTNSKSSLTLTKK